VFRDRHSPHVATLNFHGVTLKHAFPVVKEVHHTQWSVQVDVIDAPDLVLVLPARKEIYRNAALDRLVALCREAIFSVIHEEPFHRLSFENWIEASLYRDDFPQAARQLPLWYPTLARDSYREVPRFADLEPGAAIYDDTDSFDAVSRLGTAVEGLVLEAVDDAGEFERGLEVLMDDRLSRGSGNAEERGVTGEFP
jgi:hypothetical protein